MKKGLFSILCFVFTGLYGVAQSDSAAIQSQYTALSEAKSDAVDGQVYKLKAAVDIPLTAATTAWTIYGFQQIYNKDESSIAQINALNSADINGFDRWAAKVYSEKAANASDMLFYGSMPLPILLMADKAMRKDAAKIGFLYLETMAVTGLIYTGTATLVDRYRPLAYNEEVDMDTRKSGNAKNSFLAGHVALVGTATFFTAKIFGDYHPDSPLKWVFYGGAAAATATTGYLRHRGGRHFPTDILVGAAVGTLSGILVPQFHKNKTFKDKGLTVAPLIGKVNGFSLQYTL